MMISFSFSCRRVVLLVILAVLLSASAGARDTMVIDSARTQTAVLDPVNWDKVFPDERYFDALRAMLVRFPGLTEQVYPQLQQGYRIEKAELVLTWKEQEGARPERGRGGWGADELYKNDPGEWHVQVWALRRPWSIDHPELGPTFNAWINGKGYWNRGGARGDETDRFARLFGPLPLHANSPIARLDVTPLLTEPSYGATPGERLRGLEERGFQVHKMEIRDMKYRNFYAYDWSVGIGYMKIWVEQPRLVVTLVRDGKAEKLGKLPPAVDMTTLVEKAAHGTPALAVPANWADRIAKHLAKPDGVPDWQWKRIEELRAIGPEPSDSILFLGRGFNFAPLWAGNEAAYLQAMRHLMAMAPRTWQGHPTADFAILPMAYGDLLPPAAIDHLKIYWSSWLHPEAEQGLDRYIGGGTHRGGPTYFRGYTRSMGTTNFNHNAISGALLGGQLIESPSVMKDARYGLENVLLRMQIFSDGAHQEIGDTYYQAITVAGAGAIAKYAQDPTDRLMGCMLRDRLVEPLISMYHPGLHRMTHPMARGDYSYQVLLQEGPYNVLHTLSPQGVLLHLDQLAPTRTGTPQTWGKVHGVSILGDEAPPQRIAVLSPWVEPYLADSWAQMVDEKPLPWHVYASDESSPGARPGGWHINYLGKHYALASRDNTNHDYGTIPITAQWQRGTERVKAVDDFSTLQMHFGLNGSYTPPYTSMAEFGVIQQHNKLLALKALPDRTFLEGLKTPIKSLHASVAIIATGDCGGREVWLNDRKVNDLSGARPDPGGDWKKRMFTGGAVTQAKDGDIITIRDGVTYIGLIPMTANALERDREVEISYEHPVILIHAFLRRGDEVLDLNRLYQADKKPTAGFLLEMGDVSEYPNFDAFRAHMAKIRLSLQWNDAKKIVEVACQSGDDLLEMGYDPARYPAVYRRINGQWPYLPAGVLRDTPWSVQGHTGKLEKNGAVLETEPGRTGYLLSIPKTGTVVGYNPLPDPTAWRLSLPGGAAIAADGRVSLLRAAVRPAEGLCWIDYAIKPKQTTPDMATALLVTGFAKMPVVELNGKKLGKLASVTVNGKLAYVIPLGGSAAADVVARSARFQPLVGAGQTAYFRGWKVAGPFPRDFDAVYPPEKGVDLKAAYSGLEKAKVTWKPAVKPDEQPIGPNPLDMEGLITPGKNVCAYAYAIIRADRDRQVTLFTGSDQDLAVWINGALVFQHKDYYRAFYRDQDRTVITLKQGDNPVLVKLGHHWEEWRFSFRLADLEGMPLSEGVSYVTP
ncbi:MAG: hypothetical protein ACYDBB_26020 [Armatimonadota bacterium]